MVTLTSKTITRSLLDFVMAALVAMPVIAGEKMAHTGPDKVAIKGYDTVAYFTKGQPIKGNPEFVFVWDDAKWQFTNATHRDMFASNPERYAPQFRAHCSMALSRGVKVAADPEIWTIVDGKLYLFSKGGREEFRQNPRENIKKAEANWDRAQK
jgi:YHS domain-containing protein